MKGLIRLVTRRALFSSFLERGTGSAGGAGKAVGSRVASTERTRVRLVQYTEYRLVPKSIKFTVFELKHA